MNQEPLNRRSSSVAWSRGLNWKTPRLSIYIIFAKKNSLLASFKTHRRHSDVFFRVTSLLRQSKDPEFVNLSISSKLKCMTKRILKKTKFCSSIDWGRSWDFVKTKLQRFELRKPSAFHLRLDLNNQHVFPSKPTDSANHSTTLLWINRSDSSVF